MDSNCDGPMNQSMRLRVARFFFFFFFFFFVVVFLVLFEPVHQATNN